MGGSPPRGGVRIGAAVATVVLLASPALAQTIPPKRDIARPPETSACPAEGPAGDGRSPVPEDGLGDVPSGDVHELAIDCLVWYGITKGTSVTTFEPGTPVRRDQMASFVARLIDYAADPTHAGPQGPGRSLPPAGGVNEFACDVDQTNVHYDDIQRLAAAKLVEGTGLDGDGSACFQPGTPVTRGQVAAVLEGAQVFAMGVVYDLSGGVEYFIDVAGDVHEAQINLMAAFGVAQGTGTDEAGLRRYGPGLAVRRDQMASFLARLLDFLVEEEETRPPSG